jgi:hypothetical protein
VIIGYENHEKSADLVAGKIKGFYYNDPEMKEEGGGKDLFIEIDKFANGWKKLAIFLEK